MTDTILFDLDGTLAQFYQDEFIEIYFKELSKVFIKLGLDAKTACKGIWAGTKAMVENDGAALNSKRFWDAFAGFMEIDNDVLKTVEAACDSFYTNEFNVVKSIVRHNDIPKQIVRDLAEKGYYLALATNPLFPPCAVDSRLGWIGLGKDYFKLISHYENSTYCKPNPGYYYEILSKINKKPEQCLMVGNNPAEDMCVTKLGMEVFLVTDFMENETGIDISQFRHGTIEDLEKFLTALPALNL